MLRRTRFLTGEHDPDLYVRFASALLALDELNDADLRATLTGEAPKKKQREPGDDEEEDMFGQEK